MAFRVGWRLMGVLALAVLVIVGSVFFIGGVVGGGPPSIDVFVERWDVLPSAYEGLVILGPRGYYSSHVIRLYANPVFPDRMMVYYWRPSKDFVARLAGRMGLNRLAVNITGKPFISMDFLVYVNDTHWMRVRGYSHVEFGVVGYEASTPIPRGGDLEVAVSWLRSLGLYTDNVYRVEEKGGVFLFIARFGGYEAESPAAEIEVREGRVWHANLNLILLLAKPYREFKLKDLGRAVKILKATVDIAGVLRNARGWSPDKDARISATFSTHDFSKVSIYDVELKYTANWLGYVIPIYVMRGTTDKGENFRGTVDAVDRGS